VIDDFGDFRRPEKHVFTTAAQPRPDQGERKQAEQDNRPDGQRRPDKLQKQQHGGEETDNADGRAERAVEPDGQIQPAGQRLQDRFHVWTVRHLSLSPDSSVL
jgi:hypothetical protein